MRYVSNTLSSNIDITCIHPSNVEFKQQPLHIWSENICFKWSKDNFAIFLIPCEIAKVDKEGFDIFSIEVRISPIELTEIQSSPTDVEI